MNYRNVISISMDAVITGWLGAVSRRNDGRTTLVYVQHKASRCSLEWDFGS